VIGPLRKFEKRLERIFEEPFTKAFKSGVHPLEIARRLLREIDDAKMLGVGGILAPNHFIVRLSPRDSERLAGVAMNLAAEMESLVITHTNQRGYQLISRPRVEFQLDETLREGEFSVEATLDEAAKAEPGNQKVRPGGKEKQAESRLGVLTIVEGEKAGTSHNLDMNTTRIGRAEENELVLDDPRASRFHAEIERTPAGYIIRDLQSTNGTMVRGRRVKERLLEDGDIVVVGETQMRFGLISGPRYS
jgi:hypothetical protein